MKITTLIRCFLTVAGFAIVGNLSAQQQPEENVRFRNDYYDTRRAEHDSQSVEKGGVVMLGNSITEQGWWSVLFKHRNIVNRGIGGDNTYGMLDRLPDIVALAPSKIFIMAGINDISTGRSVDVICANIARMVAMIGEKAPLCRIYIQSVLPVNYAKLAYPSYRRNEEVAGLNEMLKKLCAKTGAVYVDVASALSNEEGELRGEFTKDGIHLHPEGYVAWADYLKKHKYLK